MPIQFFSGHQDDVFIPAMVVVLIGVAIVSVPVMFAPAVARMRQRRAIVAITAVVAVAAVVSAVALGLPGFGVLSRQVETLRADAQTRYSIALSREQASDLVDGDSISVDGIAGGAKVHLLNTGPNTYLLTTGGRAAELPTRS